MHSQAKCNPVQLGYSIEAESDTGSRWSLRSPSPPFLQHDSVSSPAAPQIPSQTLSPFISFISFPSDFIYFSHKMSDFDTGPPFGFYLRHNGTCADNQIQCSSEPQWSDSYGEWFNCCPEGTFCVDNTCCPSTSGCKNSIESDPHCANNQTWDLYSQDGGYFCCEHGTIGYVNSGLMVGNSKASGVACAEHWMQGDNYDVLTAEAKG